MTDFVVHLHCTELPGRHVDGINDLQVGLQKGKVIVEAIPADREAITFAVPMQATARPEGRVDVRGPFVHGRPGERFLYLVWHSAAAPDTFLRRAKIGLNHLRAEHVARGHATVHVRLTDANGGPIAATLKPSHLRWAED